MGTDEVKGVKVLGILRPIRTSNGEFRLSHDHESVHHESTAFF